MSTIISYSNLNLNSIFKHIQFFFSIIDYFRILAIACLILLITRLSGSTAVSTTTLPLKGKLNFLKNPVPDKLCPDGGYRKQLPRKRILAQLNITFQLESSQIFIFSYITSPFAHNKDLASVAFFCPKSRVMTC